MPAQSASALYQLAAPGTSEAVRDDILARAEAGEQAADQSSAA